jgi:hypothetical protein
MIVRMMVSPSEFIVPAEDVTHGAPEKSLLLLRAVALFTPNRYRRNGQAYSATADYSFGQSVLGYLLNSKRKLPRRAVAQPLGIPEGENRKE